jgi:hypothetical protein
VRGAVRCAEPDADRDRVDDYGHSLADGHSFDDRSGDQLTCLH